MLRGLRREDVGVNLPNEFPQLSHEAAQKRVAQLEGALKASDATGPEVTMIQESLKSAKRAAQVPPLTVQVSQCEQFIARAQKRLVVHDEERILSVKQPEDGQQRLHSLRKFPSRQHQFNRHQIGEPRLRVSNKW